MATPARFELTTPSLGNWCSIRLSYGAVRTDDAQVYKVGIAHSTTFLRLSAGSNRDQSLRIDGMSLRTASDELFADPPMVMRSVPAR